MPKLGSGATNEARFWSKVRVEPGDGCWLWTAALDKDGYGKFQINTPGERKQKHVRAHRYAFFLEHGRWPDPEALHSCDTPACVRHHHLREGTRQQNHSDMAERGRTLAGSRNPHAVLTEEIVRRARAVRETRGGITALARETGLSFNALYLAASGRGWRHV